MSPSANPLAMLGAVAADWPRLSLLMAPAALDTLGERLERLRADGGTGAPGGGAVEEAARAVLDALPDEEATLLRRGADDAGRFTGTGAATVSGYGVQDLCMLVLDRNPMVGPVLGPVRDRLLAAPALPVEGPADRRLIVLTGVDGARRAPAFQYEAGSMPWPVVLEVNAVIGAERDPWGAADWWLSANAWTGTTPAGLLGRARDPELLGAARALGEW
ncbi:hypothetical protein [Streptomyces genisteinicus]|uniref:Uncharacterized protein n=1 Tax=Streptomyces genisteinicus TaxID=2768068 RepID=A0A7H0HTN9_9ACTN|nr:hypothetical protein [Streptomyces genisteinicus]QNP63905.1 hypothetical protein IAG43_13860 [Streptomyces genisteinicus]